MGASGSWRAPRRRTTRWVALRTVANRFDEPRPATDLATDHEAAPGPGRRVETQTFHDAAGRVVAVVDPLGNRTTTEYDAIGRIIRVTDAMGNRVEITYDAHGNVVRKDRLDVVRDVAGNVVGQQVLTWTGTYDERDRLVAERDGLGNTTEHQYDSLDRRVLTRDPLGNVAEVEYDVYGHLIATTERRTDDGLGTGMPLEPAVVRYERDRSGNLLAQIDARGRRTAYRYDRSNRVIEQAFPDGARVVTRYDRDDLVTAVRDAHGVVLRHEYDGGGRLIRTVVDDAEVDASVQLEGARLVEHAYDGLDRMTLARNEAATISTRRDSMGYACREDTVLHAAGELVLTLERSFDDGGRLAGITYPGGRRVRHDRDGLGRLRELVHEVDGDGYPGAGRPGPRSLAAFAYAGARLRHIARPNGVATEVAHDAAGRRIELHHRGPSGTVLRVQQLHDAARNPRLRLEAAASPTAPAPADARPERFGYDAQYQLAARAEDARRPFQGLEPFAPPAAPLVPVPHRQRRIDVAMGPLLPPAPAVPADTWRYDLVGNRTAVVTDGTTHDYGEANARDQYEAVDGVPRTYDAAGNLTHDGRFEYRYDAWRRLCRVVDLAGADVARYAYDAAGRRVVEEIAGEVPLAVCNDGVDRVADYRAGACVAQYVHGDAVDDPLHLATAGGDAWYHADHQGSVRALTDDTGALAGIHRFDPFGNLVESEGIVLGPPVEGGTAQPFGFGGRPFDPVLGLYDQRARAYDPSTGRFMQREPRGSVDGTNLYAYTANHPIEYGDPSGLSREEHASDPSCGYTAPDGTWRAYTREHGSQGYFLEGDVPGQTVGSGMFRQHRSDQVRFDAGDDGCVKIHIVEGGGLIPDAEKGPFNKSTWPEQVAHINSYREWMDVWVPALAGLRPGGFRARSSIRGAPPSHTPTGVIPRRQERAAGVVSTADELASAAGRARATVGPGRGPVYGTRAHSAFRAEVEALGNPNLSTEVSYLKGQVVPYGTRGSVRLDVVEGPLTSPTAIYDFKTGGAALGPGRIALIRSNLPGGGNGVPVLEVR